MKRLFSSTKVKKSTFLDRILGLLFTIIGIGLYIGLGIGLAMLMHCCGIEPVEIEGCL